MFLLIDHIEYLLNENDCVILPQWGAFIANHIPANYNTESFTFEPPKRSISFNSAINYNDGLLATSIARKEKCSFESARHLIEEEVISLKAQINYNNELSFGQLGTFSIGNDNNLFFEPNNRSDNESDVFGLRKIFIHPIVAQDIEPSPEKENTEDINIIGDNNQFYKKFIRIAASVIIIFALSLLLSIPSVNTDSPDKASLNVMDLKGKAPIINDVQEKVLNLVISNPKVNSTDDVESKAMVHKTATGTKRPINSHKRISYAGATNSDASNITYYIIVSSLPSQSYADRHIKKYNDPSMKILERGGKYRIYVAKSDSKDRINKLVDSVRNTYPDAWVYKELN